MIRGEVNVGTIVATTTLDGSKGSFFKVTLTANAILTVRSFQPGMTYYVLVTQDGVGGHTLTWAGQTMTVPTGLTAEPNLTAGTSTLIALVGSSVALDAVELVGNTSASSQVVDPIALPNASVNIGVNDGLWRDVPVATLTNDRTATIDTTNATAGDIIRITRYDVTNFTYAIINGGPGAGTLATFAAQTGGDVYVEFNGTDWTARESAFVSAAAVANTYAFRDGSASSAFATVTLNDLLYSSTESTPTVSFGQVSAGVGKDWTITTMLGATPGTNLAGNIIIDLGATVGGIGATLQFQNNGAALMDFGNFVAYGRWHSVGNLLASCNDFVVNATLAEEWGPGPLTLVTKTIAAAYEKAWSANATSVKYSTTAGVYFTHDSERMYVTGAVVVTPQALATTGNVPWDSKLGQNAKCVATGNVTINSITSVDGANLQLEFQPVTAKTLTISGATFSASAGGTTFTQAQLTTACATATRIIVNLVTRGATTYVTDFYAYNS